MQKTFLHHGDLSSTEWILNLIYSLAPDSFTISLRKVMSSKLRHSEYTAISQTGNDANCIESNSPQWCEDAFYQASSSGCMALLRRRKARRRSAESPSLLQSNAHWVTASIGKAIVSAANGILFNQ